MEFSLSVLIMGDATSIGYDDLWFYPPLDALASSETSVFSLGQSDL